MEGLGPKIAYISGHYRTISKADSEPRTLQSSLPDELHNSWTNYTEDSADF